MKIPTRAAKFLFSQLEKGEEFSVGITMEELFRVQPEIRLGVLELRVGLRGALRLPAPGLAHILFDSVEIPTGDEVVYVDLPMREETAREALRLFAAQAFSHLMIRVDESHVCGHWCNGKMMTDFCGDSPEDWKRCGSELEDRCEAEDA